MSQLSGKTALVTGGTSGIGLATAQRLADEGAHVFITGRRQSGVDEAVSAIGTPGTTAYDDLTASVGTRYYYVVKANNAIGAGIFAGTSTWGR